jgi:sensor domain CHASE-containing protein
MSLKYKVSLIALIFFVSYGILDYTIMRMIIIPSFVSLEQKEAEQNLDRCVSAIHRELYHLDKICLDWSSWDDTYAFALIIDQFNPDLFSMVYVLNSEGNVIWGGIKDYETKKPIQLKAFAKKKFDTSDPLLTFNFQNKPLSDVKNTGVIITEKGPVLICARPFFDRHRDKIARRTNPRCVRNPSHAKRPYKCQAQGHCRSFCQRCVILY